MKKKPGAFCSATTYCPTCPAYCCIIAGEIEVTSEEAVSIHASVGGNFDDHFRKHPKLGLLISKPASGRCRFLDENNACTIYAIRPKVCRSYFCSKDNTIFSVKKALAGAWEGEEMPKKIVGGPVLNSLDDVTALMVKLGSLIEEGGPLSRAPKEIKDITYDTLDSMKKLTYKLTDLVGESARKRDKATEKTVKEAEVACIKAKKIMGMVTAKYNQKGYKFYVVKDGAILSGWEFREDAKDFVADLAESGIRGLKIYMLGKLKQIGLDPNNNKHWRNPF